MFIIKCIKCGWREKTSGIKKDLSDANLIEIPNNCSSCGKIRKFKCKKCSQPAKMFRLNDV